MRGTFTFKPVKANLTHDTELITKMDPYCSFTLGSQSFKSQICKSGGKNPVWNDQIQIPMDSDQQFCYLQLMDQDTLTKDDNIGTATIDLFEIMNSTNRFSSKWYPIFYKNKAAGEILIEIGFNPSGQGFGNQQYGTGTQSVGLGQQNLGTQGLQGTQGFQGTQDTQSYSHHVPHTTAQPYGQGGLGTNIGQNIGQTSYGQSGLSSNIGGTGYSGSNIPLGTHNSLEDPLYGKTVDVKPAGVHGSTGYSGSNLGYQQGSNLGQGGNLDYQQGSNLGQGNLGQQGTYGTRDQGLLGKAERTAENIASNLNPNQNQQQFTQPGFN